jgi:hypothetical protein
MAANDVTMPATDGSGGVRRAARRLSTETKSFFKTSEFWIYIAVVAGILIAGNSIGDSGKGGDYFNATQVWLYIAIVTLGYLLSRGIAKSGSRQPYWDNGDDGR